MFDILDHPNGRTSGPSSRVQIDCPRCRYVLWLYYRYLGEGELPKRNIVVIHTVRLDRAKVIHTDIYVGPDAGTENARRTCPQRPATDLDAALSGWGEHADPGEQDPDELSEPTEVHPHGD